MVNDGRPRFARALLAVLVGSAFAPAFAQTATPEQSKASQQAGEAPIQEIVITAERRSQRLQDVPISATVLSGADLAAKGVTTLNSMQQVAPSVAINTYNRSTFINIRGVGIAQSAPTSNPGVAFYIDGQIFPHEQFIAHSFFDIGSIEVLRGPQGTLTGQNSTGGALYLRSPEPKYNATFGSVDLSAGNYSAYRGVGAVNVGLSPNFAVRLAYMHDERDSYSNNIGPSGSTPGNAKTDSVRLNLAGRTDDASHRFNLHYENFNFKSDNNAVKNRFDKVTADPFTIEEDAKSYLNQSGSRVALEDRWAFREGLELRTQLAYQDGSSLDAVDGDRSATALPVPAALPATSANKALYPGRTGINGTDIKTLVGEVNLISTGDGPFNWVAGAFFMRDNLDVPLYLDSYHTSNFVASNSTIHLFTHNLSKSLFGQANWFATDKLELLGGARYSWDSQDVTVFQLQGAPLVPPPVNSTSSSQLTGKLGLNLHAEKNLLLYATASKGYKAGGNNPIPGSTPFGPEHNLVYEAGVKTNTPDRRFRVNADVFYSDYKDIQLQSTITLPLTQNAAKGKAYGAEFEGFMDLGAFTGNIGVSYLNATFAQNACITNSGLGTKASTDPCPGTNQLVPEGRVLPFSPKWTINAGVQYEIALDGGRKLTPRLQWAHLAEQVATPFPGADTLVPERDIFDARLSLQVNKAWLVEGYVNNLSNKTYIASQVQNATSATGGIIYGAPRTFGVRANVKFN